MLLYKKLLPMTFGTALVGRPAEQGVRHPVTRTSHVIRSVTFCSRCTVVLFSPKKNRQSHLLNSSRKTITSLAFSADGHYLVTGECGHLPSVRVWDLQEGGGTQIAEFAGHKYGISCVVSMH